MTRRNALPPRPPTKAGETGPVTAFKIPLAPHLVCIRAPGLPGPCSAMGTVHHGRHLRHNAAPPVTGIKAVAVARLHQGHDAAPPPPETAALLLVFAAMVGRQQHGVRRSRAHATSKAASWGSSIAPTSKAIWLPAVMRSTHDSALGLCVPAGSPGPGCQDLKTHAVPHCQCMPACSARQDAATWRCYRWPRTDQVRLGLLCQHGRGTAHVVGVAVAEHQGIDPAPAAPAAAATITRWPASLSRL